MIWGVLAITVGVGAFNIRRAYFLQKIVVEQGLVLHALVELERIRVYDSKQSRKLAIDQE